MNVNVNVSANFFFFFHSYTVHLDKSIFLILSDGCTIKYSKKMLKFTLKLTLKLLLHVSA